MISTRVLPFFGQISYVVSYTPLLGTVTAKLLVYVFMALMAVPGE